MDKRNRLKIRSTDTPVSATVPRAHRHNKLFNPFLQSETDLPSDTISANHSVVATPVRRSVFTPAEESARNSSESAAAHPADATRNSNLKSTDGATCRDSSVIEESSTHTLATSRSADALPHSSLVDIQPIKTAKAPEKENAASRHDIIATVCDAVTIHLSKIIIALLLIFIICKPTTPDYTVILDEIAEMRSKMQNSVEGAPTTKEAPAMSAPTSVEPTNRALVEEGASIQLLSAPMTYGLFGRTTADPNAALDAGSTRMSLRGSSGSFKIQLGQETRVTSVGLYHPPTGNAKSAVRTFEIQTGGLACSCEYRGWGYQEFVLPEEAIVKDLTIIVHSNYGERYTTVYRVYVKGIYV